MPKARARKAIIKFRMFTSSGLNRNTSENNKEKEKSKSKNKILNDRLYLDMVKFMNNNPIFVFFLIIKPLFFCFCFLGGFLPRKLYRTVVLCRRARRRVQRLILVMGEKVPWIRGSEGNSHLEERQGVGARGCRCKRRCQLVSTYSI